MNYRFQEIMKMVVPGFLLIIIIVVFNSAYEVEFYGEVGKLVKRVKPISNALLVIVLPFVAFIIGYLVNMVASFCERYSYKFNIIDRPSHKLLKIESMYTKEQRQRLIALINHKDEYNICRKQAGLIFKKVKEILKRSHDVDEFYYQSVMARNILSAYSIGWIYGVIMVFRKSLAFSEFGWLWFASVVLWLCLFFQWCRNNKTYARRLIAEYLAS
ncbi:hypothetical protein L6475_10120 [Prevotella sp. E9-3]|uniref:hypothetical protein n=1 Tax=Prevotella sp. E9-3 TaxID=2913621 RepID=UPI001EDC0A84|nr:hypothetical protein [Prevotella sp. E9-3]UKK47575.1 hypothetical protein L6475_10120 [Prevotella sp. E9-3]